MRRQLPIILVTLLLILSIPGSIDPSEGYDPATRATMNVDDLEIDGNVTHSNVTIVVNGNITIKENSTLILDDCNVQFTGAGNGTRGIIVEKNGSNILSMSSLSIPGPSSLKSIRIMSSSLAVVMSRIPFP